MWRMAVAGLVMVRVAHADAVRDEHRLAIGLALPDELYISGHDATVPLPTVRVGYSLAPTISLELAAGGAPTTNGGHHILAHAGARYRFTDGAVAPFAMARLGAYKSAPDEGSGGTYEFALAGGGLEYVRSRLAIWLDLGAGLVNYQGATLAIGGSLGVAARL